MAELLLVVGARPNFMKAASVAEAARASDIACTIVHTGQHYDDELSRIFFEELSLPLPDVDLGVGSGTHAAQTARVMLAFEAELRRINPSIVAVVGDVNSTLACALVAAKEHYPVAHVEAGLRSYDERMPEEINRRLCDHISAFLFTPSRDADENLIREGIPVERISFVGNTMIDTLLRFQEVARARQFPKSLGLAGDRYVALTMHRPETVDDPGNLSEIVDAISAISTRVPLVFPLHPRTRERLADGALLKRLRSDPNVILLPPLGYLDFLGLISEAAVILTDSGGVQEETTVLGRPCLTLRERTERPITVTEGTNHVVGVNAPKITAETVRLLGSPETTKHVPEFWDGKAGERIVALLERALESEAAWRIGA